jgi:hypothetical protein
MARKSSVSEPKRKAVNVKLIERKHAGKIVEPYRILEALVAEFHEHLKDAKIALAWRFGWRADADGRLRLGSCKKGSDLDRALANYDFVIQLNHEAWNQSGFDSEKRTALIDHELCHAQVACDTNGEPKLDDQGRTCYRIRKHDVEEFSEVVARHGCYKADLEHFAAQMGKTPLFGDPDSAPKRKALAKEEGKAVAGKVG